jgi:DNA-binding NarL/FixJ family response regulator
LTVRGLDHVERICRRDLDERSLRIALVGEVRAAVPSDAYAWISTDPETCVGAAPLAEIPTLDVLPALIKLKYATPTNRWTTLPSNTAVTLTAEGPRSRSELWRDILALGGIDDVVSTVFRDEYGCWGFLDLWRRDGAFTADECTWLSGMARLVTTPLRRSLLTTFDSGSAVAVPEGGPAVLLLSDELQLLTATPQTALYLRALLPTEAERSAVPAAAYNAAAQLLAREKGIDAHPPSARVLLGDGQWMTVRAARMARSGAEASIAVSIEATPPAERIALFVRVGGLSEREAELVLHLAGGLDTHELAQQLFVSEHTVQDHFKSIFAKTGVNSRRTLIARATGATVQRR